nr:hypothetical protein [Tanacetum cinerariifolium]
MARVSKTGPFRVRSHAEMMVDTDTESENKEDIASEPIPEEDNSSSSTSDEEKNKHEKGKGKRIIKGRKQKMRSVIALSYSPKQAKEVIKKDDAFKRKAAVMERKKKLMFLSFRIPPKERGVNDGGGAGRKRKRKEKETDDFELSNTELEEAYKKFRMDRNDDDDSDEDGGGDGRKRKGKEKETDDFELSDTELEQVA